MATLAGLLILMAQLYYSVYTVQTSQITGTLTDFPVLVKWTDARFKSVANGGHVNRSDGRDLVPYSDTTLATKLDFERILYDPTTGAFIDWVRVSSAAVGSTITYGYGDTSITTDQSNKTGVWDSHFKGVWHFPDPSSLSALDSTSDGNNGTISGPTAASGRIDGAASFSGSSDKISVGTSNSLDITGRSLAITAWINPASAGGASFGRIFHRNNGSGGYAFFLRDTGGSTKALALNVNAGSTLGGNAGTANNGYTLSTLQQVGVVYAGSGDVRFYRNGSALTVADNMTESIASDSGDTGYIGNRSGLDRNFDGLIDELRISDTPRSADWIAAEYNNQSAPTSFLGLGAEQSLGGGTDLGISSFRHFRESGQRANLRRLVFVRHPHESFFVPERMFA